MPVKEEEKVALDDMSFVVRQGLNKYKEAIKDILTREMEEIYGGVKDFPNCTEENEDAVMGIWDRAISECIKIVGYL